MSGSEPEKFGGSPEGRRCWRAFWRGLNKRCPRCGKGALFAGYVKTRDQCAHCGLEFSGHQADDAPPYVTIMIVGHALIPLALATKQLFDPPLGLQFAIWTPLLILSTAWLLPVSKGGLVAIQWANRMHGFGEEPSDPGRYEGGEEDREYA